MTRRALLLCLAVPALVCAQTPRNRAPLPNEQWVKLFNGKDLTNWVPVGHEKWTVEDGDDSRPGRHEGIRLPAHREEVQGFLAVGPLQVRGRRQQRRLLPHRVQGRHAGDLARACSSRSTAR